MNVSPEQIRAARALLRLDQAELARRAHVSVVTIRRIEGADRSERVTAATLDGVRMAMEQAGAEFITDGVRRRHAAPPAAPLYEDLRAISLRSAERLRGREVLTDTDQICTTRTACPRDFPRVIVVDSSALIAILGRKPETDHFLAEGAGDPTCWAELDALVARAPT